MAFNEYRFRSVWMLEAPPALVLTALRELREYPAWWPEVRSVAQIDDDTAELRCRSALPYELVFTVRRSREDAASGVLEATMAGDLDGFSRWTISPRAGGRAAEAVFEEVVTARKALLRRTALVARPAFVANHAAMMRHGRRGLGAYLAGMAFATQL